MAWLQWLDRLIGQVIAAAQWLILPLILLLFLQWPLRDIVHRCSLQANDLGQIFFALLVAVSVTASTRAGTHLAANTLAQHYSSTCDYANDDGRSDPVYLLGRGASDFGSAVQDNALTRVHFYRHGLA